MAYKTRQTARVQVTDVRQNIGYTTESLGFKYTLVIGNRSPLRLIQEREKPYGSYAAAKAAGRNALNRIRQSKNVE